MLTAQGHIAVISADFGLFALLHGRARGIDPQVHRRFAAAVAHRFQLDQRIRDPQQHLGTGEQLALKIGPQAVAQHRDLGLVGKPGKLPDLRFGQKLRFIDQHAGQRLHPVGRFDPLRRRDLERWTRALEPIDLVRWAARLDPGFWETHLPHGDWFGLDATDRAIGLCRLQKLVTRNLGVLHFQQPFNDDPTSPLVSSLVGLDDLDRAAEEF